MSDPTTLQFPKVTALAKANIYFDGKVLSHTIVAEDGRRRTLGIIFPGSYYFGTEAAELMDIVAGSCAVTIDGQTETKTYAVGARFEVPARSGFTIVVNESVCEYVCEFLD